MAKGPGRSGRPFPHSAQAPKHSAHGCRGGQAHDMVAFIGLAEMARGS